MNSNDIHIKAGFTNEFGLSDLGFCRNSENDLSQAEK
jgi:hypothetical protein